MRIKNHGNSKWTAWVRRSDVQLRLVFRIRIRGFRIWGFAMSDYPPQVQDRSA